RALTNLLPGSDSTIFIDQETKEIIYPLPGVPILFTGTHFYKHFGFGKDFILSHTPPKTKKTPQIRALLAVDFVPM
ncbi:MAG: hypothetical protein KDD40_09255, partial [Bdellovibrionales bacterium]|nr:hypothetical protein [Bdellovibrionales bacterium]